MKPGPWADDRTVVPVVAGFDGAVLSGPGSAAFVTGYAKMFRAHPEITSVVHVHTPVSATSIRQFCDSVIDRPGDAAAHRDGVAGDGDAAW